MGCPGGSELDELSRKRAQKREMELTLAKLAKGAKAGREGKG